MRFNSSEVLRLSQDDPDWEGRLFYMPPEKSTQPSIIKSGARSAAKLGNGIVKSIAGVGATGLIYPPQIASRNCQTSNGRDRWFRIKGNLLFYFKLTAEGRKPPLPGTDPIGVIVLEHFHVQKEGFENHQSNLPNNQFSLIFADEPDKRHFFIAESQQRASQWETVLKQASYQKLRERLVDLQIKLRDKTGEDPLQGSSLQSNPVFTNIKLPSNIASSDTQNEFSSSFNVLKQPQANTMPAKIAPPPRTKKQKNKKTFESHIVNDWESISSTVIAKEATEDAFMEPVKGKSATFKSHLSDDVAVDNLIEF